MTRLAFVGLMIAAAAAGCGSDSGPSVATACEKMAAAATEACVTEAGEAWRSCYVDGGAPCESDDPAVVDRCFEEITEIMQATLDRLAEEHPHPLMERLRALLPGVHAGGN